MIAVACHKIAVHLFNLPGKGHRDLKAEDWRKPSPPGYLTGCKSQPFLTPFAHHSYTNYEQYPEGIGDVVGYWAEDRIFGGVVVFDRGDSESEVDPSPQHFDACSNMGLVRHSLLLLPRC